MLIHHKFFNDEINIKLGGDHRGGSFKINFQVCNTSRPNSKDNTTVFSIFEAKDLWSNMEIGISRFSKQVNELQTMEWE